MFAASAEEELTLGKRATIDTPISSDKENGAWRSR
jgi:hypothetical protein